MENSPADAVRRVLTAAGITGAALTLSAAAALPAIASDHGGDGDDSSTHASQPAQTHHSDSDQSDADKGDTGKSGHDDGDAHRSSKASAGTDDNGPGGNNGHAFIKQAGSDLSREGNQPHVSCAFNVSFFGFDRGQVLDVSFDGQAPSGSAHAGGGSFTVPTSVTTTGDTFDGSLAPADKPLSLDVSGLTASKQGYHIKMTVTTHQPGGHKYKVFWYQPCASAPQQGTQQQGAQQQQTSNEQQSAGQQQAAATAATGQQTGAAVLGESISKGATTSAAPAQVLGESISRAPSRPATSAQVLGGAASLPFTGAEIGLLSAAGIAAIGGGAALTVAGRRRRRAAMTR